MSSVKARDAFFPMFIWVSVFAIAMGYLESAVVIYIREVYYPGGFSFPLKVMAPGLIVTELFRELSTLIMLVAVAFIAGKNRWERFGYFLMAFGWWDIFYYIFLKVLIGWPENFLTWDILFMLPTTWVGPVLAPILNALNMVILGGLIGYFSTGKSTGSGFSITEWMLLLIGSGIILYTYMEDYVMFVSGELGLWRTFFPANTHEMMEIATQYIPRHFSWWIFSIGQLFLAAGTIAFFARIRKEEESASNY